MRRLLPILLVLLFLLPFPALAEGENLLVNGSVDDVSAAGFPTGWEQDMWFTGADVSQLSVESGGVEGSCLRVENMSVNDARWAQVVEVEPNTIYRFSAMVRAEGVVRAATARTSPSAASTSIRKCSTTPAATGWSCR